MGRPRTRALTPLTPEQRKLVELYLPLCKKVAAKTRTSLSAEDALSAAYLGLVEEAADWRGYPLSFGAAATVRMRSRIIDEARREQRHRKGSVPVGRTPLQRERG